MTEVHVGDEWVQVSPGYVQAECEYNDDFTTEWEIQLYNGNVDEELRQKILDARVEFYKLYKEGRITIINHRKKESWWTKAWRVLSGQSTQTDQGVPRSFSIRD